MAVGLSLLSTLSLSLLLSLSMLVIHCLGFPGYIHCVRDVVTRPRDHGGESLHVFGAHQHPHLADVPPPHGRALYWAGKTTPLYTNRCNRLRLVFVP